MTLQDVIDGMSIIDINDNDKSEKLSTLNISSNTGQELFSLKEQLAVFRTPLDEFYDLPDFRLQVSIILSQLNKEKCNTYINYDKDSFVFKNITKEKDENSISLKRNSYTVFKFLVYGFSKKEIMQILHVSRSYIFIAMQSIKKASADLVDFYDEIRDTRHNII